MKKTEIDQIWQVPIAPDLQFIRVSIAHDGQNIVPLIYPTKAGNECVDFLGISADLKQVIECCALYLTTADDEHAKRVALYECCLIRYRRCFVTGVRRPLKSGVIEGLTRDERDIHDYYLDMANKFVAHSVNSSETLLPVVIPGAGVGGGHGYAFLNIRHTGDANDKMHHLGLLASKILKDIVDPEISRLSEIYQEEVSRLVDTDFEKLAPAHIPVNKKAVPGSRRK